MSSSSPSPKDNFCGYGQYRGDRTPTQSLAIHELYEQLNKKDKDLMMAAQIGKALLATNQELMVHNESMVVQYEHKMEELEQEKYNLRLKLNSIQDEYENKAIEFQNDIIYLRKEVDKHQNLLKFTDNQNISKIDQMKTENIYMQKQLEEIGENEVRYKNEIESLKQHCKLRKDTMHQNLSLMEQMRQEINQLTSKKLDLEKKINSTMAEKEQLNIKCENYEKKNSELVEESENQDKILKQKLQDIKELERFNEKLAEDLKRDQNFGGSTRNTQQKLTMASSLMEELENALTIPDKDNFDSLMVIDDLSLMDEFSMLPTDYLGEPYQFATDSDNIDMMIVSDRKNQENLELKEEIYDAYKHLKGMCQELKQRQELFDEYYHGNIDDVERDFCHAGCLMSIINELRGLLQDLIPTGERTVECVGSVAATSPTEQVVTRYNLLALRGDLSVTKRYLNNMKQRMETQEIEMEKQIGNFQDLELRMESQREIVKQIQNERIAS